MKLIQTLNLRFSAQRSLRTFQFKIVFQRQSNLKSKPQACVGVNTQFLFVLGLLFSDFSDNISLQSLRKVISDNFWVDYVIKLQLVF